MKIPNIIWNEQKQYGDYILYTEDLSLIRKIKSWTQYRNKVIRDHAVYHISVNHDSIFAVQFRFPHKLLKQVSKASNVKTVIDGWE